MKYKGKKLEGCNTDILVLPRGTERIVFKAQAIQNYDEFNKLCPAPEPPTKLLPGGFREPNPNDPNHLKKLTEFATKKTDYSIIKALEISEDIEWENVHLDKPETWKNWRTELQEAGFTEIEILRVMQLCTRVNALDDDLLDQAKQDFLAGALQQGE